MKKLTSMYKRYMFHPILYKTCLLYTSPSPRDTERYRKPSSA